MDTEEQQRHLASGLAMVAHTQTQVLEMPTASSYEGGGSRSISDGAVGYDQSIQIKCDIVVFLVLTNWPPSVISGSVSNKE